jgi:hypothetical protein
MAKSLGQRVFPRFANQSPQNLAETSRAWAYRDKGFGMFTSCKGPEQRKQDEEDETYTSPVGLAISYEYSALSLMNFSICKRDRALPSDKKRFQQYLLHDRH